ncbi:alpha/beta hydrolase fold domain-containing protein [Taklimakanibacter lacteus]|uniref:alpha/beta hydrolase fold domain-containing protein n=1 Tax=Taklimakanibacter lacteus TaxID=2268456 RepID=UPI000E674292
MSARQRLRLDWQRGNVRNLRAAYERARHVTPEGPHEWQMIDAGDRLIRLLVHNPGIHRDRAIFYFHGGGWIVGSPSTHADISEALAAASGLPVISIDYRLAPEHKAEAALADGLAVIGHYLGIEGAFASGILAGDSAGGALALATASRARRMGLQIAGAMSFYGGFGLTANPRLHGAAAARDGLDAGSMRRYWLAANASAGEGICSLPALARGLDAPVYLLIAGRDPLRNDSLALARALRAKAHPVTIDPHPFEGHSFLQSSCARRSKQIAFRRMADWIGS